MYFVVFGDGGRVLYEGGSWPMACAACDCADLRGEDFLRLDVLSERE